MCTSRSESIYIGSIEQFLKQHIWHIHIQNEICFYNIIITTFTQSIYTVYIKQYFSKSSYFNFKR